MRTTVDLINLSPIAIFDGDILNKVWTGNDVSYDHLRVFDCKAFVHVPKDQRSNLDDKAKPCIFMGYGHEQFGYRLWDPINKKIIKSKDVMSLEDQVIIVTKVNLQVPLLESLSIWILYPLLWRMLNKGKMPKKMVMMQLMYKFIQLME